MINRKIFCKSGPRYEFNQSIYCYMEARRIEFVRGKLFSADDSHTQSVERHSILKKEECHKVDLRMLFDDADLQ